MGDRIYRFGRVLIRIPMQTLFPLRVIGREHVPEQGGVVLCANHGSNWDPVLLGLSVSRPIHFMAKEELFRVPGLAPLVRGLGAFPVRRGAADRAALRTAVQLARGGRVVGLFPEGTRRRRGKVGRPMPGAGMVAVRSGAPVIPVHIDAGYRPGSRVTVRFGPPVDLSPWMNRRLSSREYAEVASAIMDTVYRLPGSEGSSAVRAGSG
ncbi:MAG: lysophospholipid acyltransferase family protein [Kyrpidia sp.]|nr:lysophospholipid acyltransferase family protein [Kyrpidia sp.]